MPPIPYDVVENILDWANALTPRNLAVRTLESAAVVSRAWTLRCQQHLFETIYLRDHPTGDVGRLVQPRLAFLWTRPRLARLVRRLVVTHLVIPIELIRTWAPLLFPNVVRLSTLHLSLGIRILESPSLAVSFRSLRELSVVETGPGVLIDARLDLSTTRLSRLIVHSRGGIMTLMASALIVSPSVNSLKYVGFRCGSHQDLAAAMQMFRACVRVEIILDFMNWNFKLSHRTSLGGGLFFIAPTIPDSVMFIRAIIHMLGDQPGLRAMQIKFTSFGPESVFHPFFEAAERRITSAIMTQKLATQIQILQLLFPTNVVEIREEYEFKRLFGAANRPGIIHMDMPGRQQQN